MHAMRATATAAMCSATGAHAVARVSPISNATAVFAGVADPLAATDATSVAATTRRATVPFPVPTPVPKLDCTASAKSARPRSRYARWACFVKSARSARPGCVSGQVSPVGCSMNVHTGRASAPSRARRITSAVRGTVVWKVNACGCARWTAQGGTAPRTARRTSNATTGMSASRTSACRVATTTARRASASTSTGAAGDPCTPASPGERPVPAVPRVPCVRARTARTRGAVVPPSLVRTA